MGHRRALVRRGLQSLLKAFHDLEVVGEAASGEEAPQKIESWMPDVVVMDMLIDTLFHVLRFR